SGPWLPDDAKTINALRSIAATLRVCKLLSCTLSRFVAPASPGLRLWNCVLTESRRHFPGGAVPIEVDPAWHETNFGDSWLRVALNFPGGPAADEARFAAQVLGLGPGARVLDMPCGHGRHSVELARRGVAVTGVDSSAASIRLAIEAAKDGSLESLADFHVG